MSIRVAIVSVVPSPYQRDLFAALAERSEVELSVFYLEAAAPDSPWPKKPLARYESILRGGWLPIGSARVHWNVPPCLDDFDVVVMNTLMSFTGQWLMRTALRGRRWIFWGERLTGSGSLHDLLSAPLHRASAIAAIGSLAQRSYAARFPRPRSFCIPYFCELERFLAAPRPSANGEVVFLFCGQMIARKGIDLLLNAFASVKGAKLLLVGREASVQTQLAALAPEVRERIEFAGFHAPEDLPQLFARAHVFVLPSRHDGWGVVVNQALGAGMPIICSDAVGAAHDLIEPKVNGRIVPAGDVSKLAQAMQRFVDEPATIAAFGEASRAKAVAWTPAAGAQRWIEAIQTVLAA